MEGKFYKIITRPAIDSSQGDFFGEVGQIVVATKVESVFNDMIHIKLLSPRNNQCKTNFSCRIDRLEEF